MHFFKHLSCSTILCATVLMKLESCAHSFLYQHIYVIEAFSDYLQIHIYWFQVSTMADCTDTLRNAKVERRNNEGTIRVCKPQLHYCPKQTSEPESTNNYFLYTWNHALAGNLLGQSEYHQNHINVFIGMMHNAMLVDSGAALLAY